MNFRMFSAAGLMLALAGCTTVSVGMPTNPIDQRWVGKSAGGFFASFGPPIADRDEGGNRVYTWRGGYKTIKVATGEGAEGKKAGVRTIHASCKADIVTSSDYTIRAIHILGDVPGATGSSYCAELLAPADPAKS